MTKFEVFQKCINREIDSFEVNNITIDSRNIQKNDVFIAIRGGNDYIEEAISKGAFVIYDDETKKIINNRAIYVKESIEFLQMFAEMWRNNLEQIKIIGITGSNGKTTVKDILYELLSTKFRGKKTEGNYNNHIGLPLTLLRMEQEDEFMVLEMGMSGLGEIDLLSKISTPNYGIITNIGDSHLEQLKTRDNVFKAKSEIVKYVTDKMFYNYDDEYLSDLEGIKVSTKSNKADYWASKIEQKDNFTTFILNSTTLIKTNLIGDYNVLNLLFGIAISKELGIEDILIDKVYENFKLTPMRFEKIENNDKIYINDAYNASPISMEKSLETFSKIYTDYYKIIVLGDMLELGDDEEKFHRNISKTLLKTKQDKVYLYGKRMYFLYDELKKQENIDVTHFENKEDIASKIEEFKNKKIVILLKGSRGMKLEEIIR